MTDQQTQRLGLPLLQVLNLRAQLPRLHLALVQTLAQATGIGRGVTRRQPAHQQQRQQPCHGDHGPRTPMCTLRRTAQGDLKTR